MRALRSCDPWATAWTERRADGSPTSAGGTGNHALALSHEGWDPVVVDRSAAMLVQAAAKGLATVEADAQSLPFDDESFDAVMLISMLHHVADRAAALAEARRVLKVGGRLVLMGFAEEDSATLWVLDYFPVSRPWMHATHPPRAAWLDELPGARQVDFAFKDLDDGSLAGRERRSLACARGGPERRDVLLRAPPPRSPGRACRRHPAPGSRHRGGPRATPRW